MKHVLTYGTFDLLHIGHIRLLERAKALGSHLTVAVSTDAFNLHQKNKKCVLSYHDRAFMVKALACVDSVIPEESWDQKLSDVAKYQIDIFVMGDDWRGKFDFLKEHCDVVYLSRTPNISSTAIKSIIRADANSFAKHEII